MVVLWIKRILNCYKKSPISRGALPVFFNWKEKLSFKSVSPDSKLIQLSETKSSSLLTQDFETTTDWKIHSGAGDFTSI